MEAWSVGGWQGFGSWLELQALSGGWACTSRHASPVSEDLRELISVADFVIFFLFLFFYLASGWAEHITTPCAPAGESQPREQCHLTRPFGRRLPPPNGRVGCLLLLSAGGPPTLRCLD